MLVVCDSSPLFALAICDQLDLLEKLYDEVYIPEAVYKEAGISGKPNAKMLTEWAKGKVVKITDTEFCHALRLNVHKGEAEAITLYKEKSADFLLIDEKKARFVAEYYGVKVIGTLGLLLKAKQEGLIPAIKPLIDKLQQESTIWIKPALYRRIIERAGEADQDKSR